MYNFIEPSSRPENNILKWKRNCRTSVKYWKFQNPFGQSFYSLTQVCIKGSTVHFA